MNLEQLQSRLRDLSKLSTEYEPILRPSNGSPRELAGYSPAFLYHAVYKTVVKADPNFERECQYILDQAVYMEQLGPSVCPKILHVSPYGYYMPYLRPVVPAVEHACIIEGILSHHLWIRPPAAYKGPWRKEIKETVGVEIPDWAMDGYRCLVHGDATIDNLLLNIDGCYLITDPIPPKYLNRPFIAAVDWGRILQSILGWERVLRGIPLIQYRWPQFMEYEESAWKATFWCMVTLKRIGRKYDSTPGQWAGRVAEELQCLVQEHST